MPACYIWKCDCGIEWKTFRSAREQKQVHVCMCKRRYEVAGSVTHLFYSSNPQHPMDQSWNEVPIAQFKDRLADA
jgi:hypothetical protein